ncbi:hypothetical protein Nepgr_002525 [Nepenthes gracilis]|uniref:Uncharacterized protein n=1 Tax=Nepenthes gracilis TaxID=150966 RepID=A0AAD3P6F2_NEPGR|nr:hypothetical protein Nepgr_002525 [Nepenthes gracilis]
MKAESRGREDLATTTVKSLLRPRGLPSFQTVWVIEPKLLRPLQKLKASTTVKSLLRPRFQTVWAIEPKLLRPLKKLKASTTVKSVLRPSFQTVWAIEPKLLRPLKRLKASFSYSCKSILSLPEKIYQNDIFS